MEVNPHPPSDSLMDDSEISLTVELEYQQALRPCGDMSKLYCPHGGRCLLFFLYFDGLPNVQGWQKPRFFFSKNPPQLDFTG